MILSIINKNKKNATFIKANYFASEFAFKSVFIFSILFVIFALFFQGKAQAQAIYSCVDQKGRRITSDRPISECFDREQRELNPSGTVKRHIPPQLTVQEKAEIKAAQEAKQLQIDEENNRLNELRRRDKALIARYQNQSAHDKARADALEQINDLIKQGKERLSDLYLQDKSLQKEAEPYANAPDKMPVALKRKQENSRQDLELQQRFVNNSLEEKQRIEARFDAELARLQQLWAASAEKSNPLNQP